MGDSAGSGGATGLCAQEQPGLGIGLGWVGAGGRCEGPGAGVRGQQGSQPAGGRTTGCTGPAQRREQSCDWWLLL